MKRSHRIQPQRMADEKHPNRRAVENITLSHAAVIGEYHRQLFRARQAPTPDPSPRHAIQNSTQVIEQNEQVNVTVDSSCCKCTIM